MKRVWQSLRQGRLSPLYLFHGTDDFLLLETAQWVWRACESAAGQPIELSTYDMEEVPIQRAVQALETPALFSTRRCIWVQRAYWLTGTNPRRVAGRKPPAHDFATLEAYIKKPCPGQVLLVSVHAPSLDKRKRLVKLLLEHAQVARFAPLTGANLRQWLQKQFRQQSVQVEAAALSLLAQRAGPAMATLRNECHKLALYAKEQSQKEGTSPFVTLSVVDQLVPAAPPEQVFQYVDCLARGEGEEAWCIFQLLRQQGVDEMQLLFLWIYRLRVLAYAKQLANAQAVVQAVRVAPFVAQQAIKQAKSFSSAQLFAWLWDALRVVDAIKQGRLPKESASEHVFLRVILSLKG